MTTPVFIARSFAVRTAAHMAHLSSESFSEHEALGEFYEALTGLVDRYAEAFMGLVGRIKSFPQAAVSNDEPITFLTSYISHDLADELADVERESLKNILSEIEELTARTLYRLKNLK